jgi:MFS transporter, UMF1 family
MSAVSAEGMTLTGTAPASRIGQASWALYEWARNPYYILVIIYIFSPYFTNVVVGDPVHGQEVWGYIISVSGFLLAVSGPILGSVADAVGARKPWLFGFTLLAVPAMASLWFARPGMGDAVMPVAISLVVTNLLFEYSVIMHNAMLPSLVSRRRVGGLSGLGLALGNASGVLLFAFVLFAWIQTEHPWFGLDAKTFEPERAIGVLTGLWFGVFAIPLFLFTPDRAGTGRGLGMAVRTGVGTLVHTIFELRRYRNIAFFVLARMIFADGFAVTLTFIGIYASGVFGWGTERLALFGIALSVVAGLASVLAGFVDDRLGSRRALLIALAIGILVNIVNVSLSSTSALFIPVSDAKILGPLSLPELVFLFVSCFGAYGIVSGLTSGRAMMARLAPPGMAAEFFGLYSFAGNATTFLAPLGVAAMTALFHSQQAGLSVVIFFLILGAALLLPVKEEQTVA